MVGNAAHPLPEGGGGWWRNSFEARIFFLRELRRSFDFKDDGEELEGSERSGAGRCPKFWAGLSV